MLVEHLERNDGVWPRNWDELTEKTYEICEGRAGGVWSIDEIRECCGIDFSANPAELVKAEVHGDDPPFKVIYLRSGATHYWSGAEPNRRILRLSSHADRAAGRPRISATSRCRRARRPTGLASFGRGSWHVNKNGRIERVHMGSLEGLPRFTDDSLRNVAALSQQRSSSCVIRIYPMQACRIWQL